MKKGFISLLILMMMTLGTLSVSAADNDETSKADITQKPKREPMNHETFIEKTDERMANFDTKINDILEGRVSAHEEAIVKADARHENQLARVTEIAPDLVDDLNAAYEEHKQVHDLLFTENYNSHVDYHAETMAGLYDLQDQVIAQVEAETMTYKEAASTLSEYVKTRKEEYKALKEAYLAEIDPLKVENEANKAAANEVKTQLKAAYDAGDLELVHDLMVELLDYSQKHLDFDFDYAKLAILETY